MTDAMTPAQARVLEDILPRLEKLEAAGKLMPSDQKLLDSYRAQRAEAKQALGREAAGYRGLATGALFGAKDEIGGAISALTGGNYAETRDNIRAKDKAAATAHPDAYNTGQTGGAVLSALVPGFGALKATQGAGMGMKMGAGGLAGGAAGGAQGFAEGEGGGWSRLQNAKMPAAIGAGFGMAAPASAGLVGVLARGASNARARLPGQSARATGILSRALERDGASGQNLDDLRDYLDNLGSEGMLADVPGNLRTTAQGLAVQPGPGGAGLNRALRERAAGASDRIRNDVDAVLGAEDAAFDERLMQAGERSGTFGPMYQAALESEGALEVRPLLNELREAARVAGPDTGSVLKKYISDLESKAENGLIDPAQLHWIRSDLSDALSGLDGPSKSNAIMTRALKGMDKVLDEVPGYADARAGYGNSFAIEEAVEAGRQVFRGGEASAMSPRQLSVELERLSPAQREAFKKGAREWIAALMGTSRNDAAAAWGQFQKGWNDEKLRILLGDAEADRLKKRLKAEHNFSVTRGLVGQGSQTQMRQEASADLADLRDPQGGQRPGPIRRVVNGANAVGNSLIDRILYAGRQDVSAQVGNMLTAQGDARDDLVQGLMREVMRRQRPTLIERGLSTPLDLAVRSAGAGVVTQY